MKRFLFLVIIAIALLSFSLHAQTVTDVSGKLSTLTQEQLKEVDRSIDALKARVTEKLVASTDGKNGQILRQFETIDSTGKKVGARKIEWTYYPGQEGKRPVDVITIMEMDAKDAVLSVKRVKHFLDERQPQEIK